MEQRYSDLQKYVKCVEASKMLREQTKIVDENLRLADDEVYVNDYAALAPRLISMVVDLESITEKVKLVKLSKDMA